MSLRKEAPHYHAIMSLLLFAAAQARAGGQGTVTVSTWNGKPAAYKTVPRTSPRTVAAEDKMVSTVRSYLRV